MAGNLGNVFATQFFYQLTNNFPAEGTSCVPPRQRHLRGENRCSDMFSSCQQRQRKLSRAAPVRDSISRRGQHLPGNISASPRQGRLSRRTGRRTHFPTRRSVKSLWHASKPPSSNPNSSASYSWQLAVPPSWQHALVDSSGRARAAFCSQAADQPLILEAIHTAPST